MKLKHLAWILFFIAFFFILLPRAKAQEVNSYTLQNSFTCVLRGEALVKVKDVKPTDKDSYCLAATKEGEEGWYAIVLPNDNSEDVLYVIQIKDEVQTVVWRKPSI